MYAIRSYYVTVRAAATDPIGQDIFSINGKKFQVVQTPADGASLDEKFIDKDAIQVFTAGANAADGDMEAIAAAVKTATGLDITADAGATTLRIQSSGLKDGNAEGGLTFQIGANGTKDQRVSLAVGDMSSKGVDVSTISVATQDDANSAIAKIDSAINSVSGTRADLGALQNRMEHTINSLGVAKENLTASESRIRDVDMAAEMMSYTKNNILSQAAQAMLAQANTLPQGVLQLLG